MNNIYFSQAFINSQIKSLKVLFPDALITDSTYHNDNRASIQIHIEDITYLLFLPNAKQSNHLKEHYSNYMLMLDEDYAFSEKTLLEVFDNITDIEQFILVF